MTVGLEKFIARGRRTQLSVAVTAPYLRIGASAPIPQKNVRDG